ncbi:Transmembrane protein 231 [Gryllus bimaculatus]|nr:Transmembrane protein 231 [Gryllus bimaculatus]
MAVYEVFSYCAKYRHKTTICSSASVFIVVISLLIILGPFLLVYRSNGFWLRTSAYREQPEVHFKYQYVLIIETEQFNNPLICSTFSYLRSTDHNEGHCAIVKSREIDNDDDGKYDELSIEFSVVLESTAIYGIKLLLVFDYKLHAMSSLQMESLGYLQHSAGLPGARFDATADLHLVQRKPLNSYGRDLKYNTSIIANENTLYQRFDLSTILKEYGRRRVSTILSNIYSLWTAGLSSDGPFILTVIIHYPEQNFIYRPRFWQVVKWAWMQYISVLLVFLYVFKSVKTYVFRNRLIPSIKYVPWKKSL